MYSVGDAAWCLVGNGLSNQSFVRGPEGLIAIDTGDSIEEMRSALLELRRHTREPVVACIYTHFHYVSGTQAILEEDPSADLQIYGHVGIEENRRRFGAEVAPRSNRGLVHQFGVLLPATGDDALLHCGLGPAYRNSAHAPHTPGYIPAQHQIREACTMRIAGLDVHITPAPSDATDSVTVWFPSLRVCANNLIWPALFNVFAIRGEEYRDPRVVLQGIDHLLSLDPVALIGTHGPPIEGTEVVNGVTDYRDAIQYIWDQTVRGINKGLTLNELTEAVQLPQRFQRSYLTHQFYGLVEHHVRQIHSGLFGWFDEDESHLFPLPAADRHQRLIAGFGGREKVRTQISQAMAAEDWRWALELATWLVRSAECEASDRNLLANALRAIAQHTLAANVRNWCLTRALELEGSLDLSRFRSHRFRDADVLAAPPTQYIDTLRVLLDPVAAAGLTCTIAWQFPRGERRGLQLREGVAIPCEARTADVELGMSHETWAQILGGKLTMNSAIDAQLLSLQGDPALFERVMQAFEHPSFC